MTREGSGGRLWQWSIWIVVTGLCYWIASSAITNVEFSMLMFASLAGMACAAVLRPQQTTSCVMLAFATVGGALLSLDLPQFGLLFLAATVAWAASRALGKQAGTGTWVGLCVAGFLVGFFSGGRGGVGDSAAYLAQWLNISLPTAERLVFEARKGIHVLFYGGVGWLAFRAVWEAERSTLDRQIGFALAVPLGLAVLDEGRQMMLPTRTGTPWDIALDMAGAIFFVGIAVYARLTGEPTTAG